MYQKTIDFIYGLMGKVGITKGQDKVLHYVLVLIATIAIYKAYGDIVAILSGAWLAISVEAYDEIRFRYGKHPTGADYFDFFFGLFGMASAIMGIGLFNVDPINNVVVPVPYLIGIFAVFCLAVWYLFSTKMRNLRK